MDISSDEEVSLVMCAAGHMSFAEVIDRHSLTRKRAKVLRTKMYRMKETQIGKS